MSRRATVYDLSRLATRVLNPTPNGIDRLDDLLAGHFLRTQPAWPLLFGLSGPRIVSDGFETVERVRASWGEHESADSERVHAAVARALASAASPARLEFQTRVTRRAARAEAIVKSLARHGLTRGRDPAAAAPRDGIYLNATHFPIEWDRHVAWLDRRPDVRPVLFVHDVLPLSRPGLFWPGEAEKHRRRLQFLARRGAGAMVTSAAAEEELRQVLADAGRHDLPVFRAAPPVQEIFFEQRRPAASGARYFVVCGTIEPRKNHLLLARVWRRLIDRFGRETPKLLVVGKRGWSTGPIVAALHAPDLRGFIVEASGVPTPAYRALLGDALALLAPSVDEGFGLTLAEALTAGVPAIASDIPAHREQAGAHILLHDPADEDAWFETLAAWARPGDPARQTAVDRLASYAPVSRVAYMDRLETFLANL